MKIIIVGGGFGGIKAALELANSRGFDVTLISDRDHFTYYPALYAVATGGSQRQSFVALDSIFAGTNITLINDTIEGYDPSRRLLRGKHGAYHFDRAVFSLGVVTSYFGIEGLAEHSFGIKSSAEVAKFRHHIHDEMIRDHKIDKQYVIVGAGPTGVELASSLASYIDHIAAAHNIRHTKIRIKLVEAAPRVLPRMSEQASNVITQRLKQIGVDVMTNEMVQRQDDDYVLVGGKKIPTHTVVWTSGVANNPFFENHAQYFTLSPNKRVVVDEHMMVNDNTYVIGDNAYTPYSGFAQTALHDAIFVAKDIKRVKRRYPRPGYKVIKPPVVIPVGKRWALLEWNWILIKDYIGHTIRRTADLIGYHDILPIGLAFGSWKAEYQQHHSCPDCSAIH